MDEFSVNPQIASFIGDHISSVAQLEILLLLQTNPKQAWTAREIARELRVETAGAAQQLELLAATGLARREPHDQDRFVYAPATPALNEATIALAQAYLVRRVTVIGLIFAKPPDALRKFSDAFRLRKDPPNEPRR